MSHFDQNFIVAIVIAFAILFVLCWAAEVLSMWRHDERNPYRRYCKYCGQQQDFYEPGGWQDVGTNHEDRHGRERSA